MSPSEQRISRAIWAVRQLDLTELQQVQRVVEQRITAAAEAQAAMVGDQQAHERRRGGGL